MIFADRAEAGRSLAWRLEKYANRHDVVVLAVPRGGVPVAFEVAVVLRAPLDVFLVRKLGVPGHEEVAFGAIASGGVRVLDRQILRTLAIAWSEVEALTAGAEQELKRREAAYRAASYRSRSPERLRFWWTTASPPARVFLRPSGLCGNYGPQRSSSRSPSLPRRLPNGWLTKWTKWFVWRRRNRSAPSGSSMMTFPKWKTKKSSSCWRATGGRSRRPRPENRSNN